jgi:hypothetical protein
MATSAAWMATLVEPKSVGCLATKVVELHRRGGTSVGASGAAQRFAVDRDRRYQVDEVAGLLLRVAAVSQVTRMSGR